MKTFKTNNIINALQKLKKNNWWIIGLDHLAETNINETLNKMNNEDRCIFVLGSEDKGIRKLIKKNCHFLMNIPNIPLTNSINVSNAAAIVFYQLYINNLKINKI